MIESYRYPNTQEKKVSEYRETMAVFLHQSVEGIGLALALIDIDDPHIAPSLNEIKEDPLIAFRRSIVLLMQKAQLHAIAARCANNKNNIHSLAVQMRPALECIGQIVSTAHEIIEKRPGFHFKLFDEMCADYFDTTIRWSRGKWDPAVILRDKFGWTKRKGKRICDSVKILEHGNSWYNHLANCFFHSKLANLKNISLYGGVESCNSADDQLSVALILDYLAHQLLVMIIYSTACASPTEKRNEFLKVAISILERKKSTSKHYQDIISSTVQT